MKKLLALLLTLLMVISFVGCSTQAKEETLETKEVTTSSEEATDKQDNYYPISFNNYNYAKEEIEQTVNKAPERVVVVYQNSIETLLALGLGDKIVGAAGLDHEIKPELADDFANLNYYEEGISKEEIMGLNPDMIVSWSSFFSDKKLGEVDFWHDRDVNTFIMSNSGVRKDRMLEHEYTDIRTLGQIFNVEEKAEKIINDIKAEIAKGKEFAKGKDPVKAVVLQLRKDGTFRIYGEDSVGGDMATQLGANLLAKDSGNIGAEDLASLNPDVIFTVYYSYFGGSVEMEDAIGKITGHEGLQSVSAVENQRVLPVKLGEVYCSGIRTMDGVKTMLKGLYPDEYND
ncbi:MAG: ABC transporter substrate-binding protein [Firmicutes bacterium]|jgi:iron complex transport system substrate-binding protein|nr:ABC transporter substrate-binding protein [Bacillota bacterium]